MAKSLYELLEVAPDAHPSEITAAFHRLIEGLESVKVTPETAEDHLNRCKALREAHSILSDAGQRASYDARLRERRRDLSYETQRGIPTEMLREIPPEMRDDPLVASRLLRPDAVVVSTPRWYARWSIIIGVAVVLIMLWNTMRAHQIQEEVLRRADESQQRVVEAERLQSEGPGPALTPEQIAQRNAEREAEREAERQRREQDRIAHNNEYERQRSIQEVDNAAQRREWELKSSEAENRRAAERARYEAERARQEQLRANEQNARESRSQLERDKRYLKKLEEENRRLRLED